MNYNNELQTQTEILMAERTFSLEEAQSLLPVLESLLRTAIDGKKLIESVDAELQEVAHRVFLNGGTFLNIVHFARRKAEREKSVQRVKDSRSKISISACSIFLVSWMAGPSCSAGGSAKKRSRTGTGSAKASPAASQSTKESRRRKERISG
ncbi:MAG: hypothetical protein DMG88_20865 [Acidobacteria bacterium]|nr:MAG: hypothetical protein DMG88_20865 [Acidobacteriota bacterium]